MDIKVHNSTGEDSAMRYICTVCNYILEGSALLAETGNHPDLNLDNLSEAYHCPVCASGKEFFQSCSCVRWPLYELTKLSSRQKKTA